MANTMETYKLHGDFYRLGEGFCERCGTSENVTFGPDRYDQEINDDDRPIWECERCRQERTDGI